MNKTMIKDYHKIIKELRQKKGLSQAEVAKRIGISRSSYITFEQGKNELKLSEVINLNNFFGISWCDFEGGLKPNYEKYKEMILAYLRKATASDGKMPKTKLAKMLYLADFAWFYSNSESMSGMQYRKIKYGPVPDLYFRAIDELEENGKISIERKDDMLLISESETSKKQNLDMLSKNEIKLIDKISAKWKDKKTNEIVYFTHNQLPYKICQQDEIIPYELITQQDPADVY
jgi:transcriptional regulator with XRE-family HTH domain